MFSVFAYVYKSLTTKSQSQQKKSQTVCQQQVRLVNDRLQDYKYNHAYYLLCNVTCSCMWGTAHWRKC